MWGHTGAPMLHVGISYSFEKKERLFIVDYIKPSPVYQVKCKFVISFQGICTQFNVRVTLMSLSYFLLSVRYGKELRLNFLYI